MYRGDCYINTFTHRMNWNFTDPDIPTNKRIVDPYTWYKNFRVLKKASALVSMGTGDISSDLIYKKLLPIFTYKKVLETSFSGEPDDQITLNTVIELDG